MNKINLYSSCNHILKRVLLLIVIIVISFGGYAFTNDTVSSDTTKKVKFAGIPMVNYASATGLMVGGMGMAFYKVNRVC